MIICSASFHEKANLQHFFKRSFARACVAEPNSVEEVSKRRLKGSETQAIRGPTSLRCPNSHACEVGRRRVQSSRAEALARGRRARMRAVGPAEPKRFPAFRQLPLQGFAQSLGESRMLCSMGPNRQDNQTRLRCRERLYQVLCCVTVASFGSFVRWIAVAMNT